ncbi:MAG TPA: HupE/UreJ family protein [Bryobacteraceae bacterium]|nr:HupE/UreJ family protein [Bryobacteraceae bacterium]
MKWAALAALFSLLLCPGTAFAHDVPNEVAIKIYLKPESGRMLMLVRIPASALIDILFPTQPESDWLDLRQIDGFAQEGARVWVADLLSVREGGQLLPHPQVRSVRISRIGNPSFDSFDGALAHVNGERLPPDTLLTQDQAVVDALLESPIQSARSDFSFEPRFARVGVRVTTSLAFLPAQGGIRQFEYDGDPETFHLDPNGSQAFTRLVPAGFAHFFQHADYLLFLLCVALIFVRIPTLAAFAVAFAVAQSVALFGYEFGLAPPDAWIPLWGILISAATVYAAIEVIVSAGDEENRWGLAIAAGLLFGSGYSFALSPFIQFGGTRRLVSVLAFNAGILAGYSLALVLLFAAVGILLRFSSAPRIASIIAAAVVLRVSWHRMLERAQDFSLASMSFPAVSNSTLTLACVAVAAAFTAYLYRTRQITSTRR